MRSRKFSDPSSFEEPTESSKKIVYPVCALNPHGMSELNCRATTLVPVRNRQGCCGNANYKPCTSPDRVCKECVLHPGPKHHPIDPETGLCEFHSQEGNSDKPQPVSLVYERPIPPINLKMRTTLLAQKPAAEPALNGVGEGHQKASEKGRRQKILSKLSPTAKQAFEEGKIDLAVAGRLSKYPDSLTWQDKLLGEYLAGTREVSSL